VRQFGQPVLAAVRGVKNLNSVHFLSVQEPYNCLLTILDSSGVPTCRDDSYGVWFQEPFA
jgi:hypothetical protein